ncbi:ESPL1 protein, partial [Tricholaema leucomelas]|nr:ESPL1 protein [Tricholaema leucomelas]
ALTASPELKPTKRKTLAFLNHPAACSCCLCSDLVLSALCLRWLLCCARAELAGGSVPQGLALLRSLLPRCATTATRFASRLRDTLQGSSTSGHLLPVLGLLDELVATAYATLALQSLANPRLAEELQEELEKGLSFLASCRPHLPSLGVSRASLLLAKATATLCHLASKHGGSLDAVFASSWAWQLPTVAPAEPEVPTAPQTLKADPPKRDPPKHKPKKSSAAPKSGVRKSQRAKAQAVPGTKDVFAMGDSEGEVPAIVLHPLPCTPCHKSCALPTKPRLGPDPRTPFTIFSESSPPASRSRLLRAPRAVGKVKSRLQVGEGSREGQLGTPGTKPSPPPVLPSQVTFSDDSDLEEAKVELSSRAPRKASCARQALSPKPPVKCQGRSKGFGGCSSVAQPHRGQPGTHRAGAKGKKKEQRVTCRAGSRRVEEDLDPLRAAEEQERDLELSFEALQLCQEEEGAPGESRRPWRGQQGEDGQQQAGMDCPAVQQAGSGHPLNPKGTISNPLPTAGEVSSLDTVLKLLKDAFNCISHCPPGTLYSQLCQLLARALGDQDPLLTAYLLSESVSITTRHQLLQILHRKIHKQKKAAEGDVVQQLQGLSLQQGGSAQAGHHLGELQELFTFSPTELGSTERDNFQAQLQQLPSGVTVCQLALASAQPGCVGDTLLVTRLEKGAAPLS